MVIVYIETGYVQVLYLGRVLRTNETLPDFHEWCRVTRHPLVFCGLTGSQRTPEIWGLTSQNIPFSLLKYSSLAVSNSTLIYGAFT